MSRINNNKKIKYHVTYIIRNDGDDDDQYPTPGIGLYLLPTNSHGGSKCPYELCVDVKRPLPYTFSAPFKNVRFIAASRALAASNIFFSNAVPCFSNNSSAMLWSFFTAIAAFSPVRKSE